MTGILTIARMDMKLFGAKLKELRKRHGLTQEEFAHLAGFDHKHYQQVESGRRKQIWVSTVERLAAPYGLEAWQLLCPKPITKKKLVISVQPSKIHYRKRDKRTMAGKVENKGD